MTREPDRIGTPSQDSDSVPLLIAPSPLLSAAVASRSGFRARMTRDVRPSPNAMGPLWIRVPRRSRTGT